jgi:hypothetical protein
MFFRRPTGCQATIGKAIRAMAITAAALRLLRMDRNALTRSCGHAVSAVALGSRCCMPINGNRPDG